MPFNTLPSEDFLNREDEHSFLLRMAELRESAVAGNVLLDGARGIGRTELLKQLYRTIFWERNNLVPFYYSFSGAALKTADFARDFFTSFIRQYLAYFRKDPSLAAVATLGRLIPVVSSSGIHWMTDLIDDFQEQTAGGYSHEQMTCAATAPATAAARRGLPVVVMLDEFHMSAQMYEQRPGDSHGLADIFESAMKNYLCPHILTGGPEGLLESVFTAGSFRGMTEKMSLGPLTEDISHHLFSSVCKKLQLNGDREASLRFMKFLGGNPLYIRNLAKALWRMRKNNFKEQDILECYAYEVSDGGTAFYWSSVLCRSMDTPELRKAAIALYMHLTKTDDGWHDLVRTSKVLGLPEPSVRKAFDALNRAGLVRPGKNAVLCGDNVLRDFMHVRYMKEVEGRTSRSVMEQLMSRHQPSAAPPACFKIVIPMSADAELVAAKAVEQICKNIKLDPALISRIQLALIESCINAMEHSGSYDKRVFLKITASDERIEIAIESRGKAFDAGPKGPLAIEERLRSADKRGWGLDLMRKIMDEVKIERIDEKTRVILIKKISADEVLK